MAGLASRIVDIASIDVTNTRTHGDPPCYAQRRRWCWQGVHQLPVWTEGSEVQRHVRAEAIHNPGALRFNFGGRVVLAGDEQCGDLEPNVRLVLEVFERLKHGS